MWSCLWKCINCPLISARGRKVPEGDLEEDCSEFVSISNAKIQPFSQGDGAEPPKVSPYSHRQVGT